MTSDGITSEELASLAMSRSHVYGFLGAVYTRLPDNQFAKNLSSPEMAGFLWSLGQTERLPEDMREGIRLVQQFTRTSEEKPVDELRADLALEFTRLLREIYPGHGTLRPYESAYLGLEQHPQMRTSVAITRAYAQAQVVLPKELDDQSDYIGFELDFMRHLCLKESEAWRENDHDRALKFLEKEQGFLNEHITRWVPRSCDEMVKDARLGFYQGIAQLTKGFVLNDADKAQECLEYATALALADSNIDKLVDGFSNENIAPTISGLDFTQENVEALLASSHCRRCGWCCLSHSFILVGCADDLRKIAKHAKLSYRYLKKKTVKYKNPDGKDLWYLPRPCMFHQENGCQIYDVRPFACRVYPISGKELSNGKIHVRVNVHCDYGKDIYGGLGKPCNGTGSEPRPDLSINHIQRKEASIID